jgi:twitching motility protein PilT
VQAGGQVREEANMDKAFPGTARVYPTEDSGELSILDMLAYFEEHGAMRVSDLHIKVGAPPAYRVDGQLVKLKGPSVTPETAKQLIYPLLSDENLQKFQSQFRSLLGHSSVDCS